MSSGGSEGNATAATRMSFADLVAPIAPEQFFAEHHGRKVLHIPGTADKFAAVMSWRKLNALLNMTGIWTNRSLTMALDGAVLPPRDYCRPAVDRSSGAMSLQPDAALVNALIARGASIILNDIDSLGGGLAAVATALEETLESRAQANLYCSWRERQAFPSHFDTHDVYALHIAGEKLWRIYEGRLDNPVEHPSFKGQPASYHETARGKVAMEILLKPGDLLYIPRGTYHDALARSDGTIHVAFSAVAVIGLDFVSALFERAVHDPVFRADLPRRHVAGGEAAFSDHMRRLATHLGQLATDAKTLDAFRSFQDNYRYRRGGFALPATPARKQAFRLTGDGFAVRRHGAGWVLAHGAKATPIPEGLDRAVAWIVARRGFAASDFAAAFPTLAESQRAEVLRSLAAMGVIAAQ